MTKAQNKPSPEHQAGSERREPKRIVRTATQARGGEIVLGRKGRWIWIGSFAAIVVIFLATLFFG